jgi:membrane dipeptidase
MAKNRGVVMADFATGYVSDARRLWNADQAAEAAREPASSWANPSGAGRMAAWAAWAAAQVLTV